MKLLVAFFRLIRWPNLFFIALTQTLFYFKVILPHLPPTYFQYQHILSSGLFSLIVLASVLIAAGGYIINDYFDINIDQINKPGKMVIEKIISRRWAILWHFMLTTIGVAISFYVGYKTNWIIFIANCGCATLLWFYSTTFKKKLLSGNIIISALTAWAVLVLYFTADIGYRGIGKLHPEIAESMQHVYKFAVLYAGFAFIISLVREVVKDMEDMEGDAKYNCTTMPIVWGIPSSKVFVAVWLIVLAGSLVIIEFYIMKLGWWLNAIYSFVLVILPVVQIYTKLRKAQTSTDYHQLSQLIKLVMLMGILSMLLLHL